MFAQTEDARVLGNDAIPGRGPLSGTFDLRQAYLDLGDAEKGHFAIRAGRQELNLADQHILGSANWLNTPRSFDAVRADVVYGKLRVGAFSASVVTVNPSTAIDHSTRANDLHGLYGTVSDVLPGATIEPYALWHLGGGFKNEEGQAVRRSVKTVALRIARRPQGQFDYELHLLRQFGTLGGNPISAYAMNFEAGWAWTQTVLQPRIFADYACASGDHHADDGRINTFDQIYPSNHGLYGIVDLFGFQNLRVEKFGIELNPARKLLFSTIFHNLNLASATDALYNGLGKRRGPEANRLSGDAPGLRVGRHSHVFGKQVHRVRHRLRPSVSRRVRYESDQDEFLQHRVLVCHIRLLVGWRAAPLPDGSAHHFFSRQQRKGPPRPAFGARRELVPAVLSMRARSTFRLKIFLRGAG